MTRKIGDAFTGAALSRLAGNAGRQMRRAFRPAPGSGTVLVRIRCLTCGKPAGRVEQRGDGSMVCRDTTDRVWTLPMFACAEHGPLDAPDWHVLAPFIETARRHAKPRTAHLDPVSGDRPLE